MVLILKLLTALGVSLVKLPSTTQPPGVRLYTQMIYASYDNTLYVTGGQLNTNSIYHDTWYYSIDNQNWQKFISSGQTEPYGRFSHGTFYIEEWDQVCVFGGLNTKGPLGDVQCLSFFELNVISIQWYTIYPQGEFIQARYRFGFTSYKRDDDDTLNFAIFSGHSQEGLMRDLCMQFLYSLTLDTTNHIWNWNKYQYEQGQGPEPRQGSVLVYYNNNLYVAAGANITGNAINAQLWKFDLINYQWHDLTSTNMYTGVLIPGVTVYEDQMYIFFGWDSVIGDESHIIYKAKLNTGANPEWQQVQIDGDGSSISRDSFGFDRNGNQFYMFGGYTLSGLKNSLITFDLNNSPMNFTLNEDYSSPSPRIKHTMEVISGNIYLFGGESNGQKLNDLWVYYPDQEYWQLLQPDGDIPSARSDHASAADGDNFVIFGGQDTTGYLNDIYKYTATSNTWEQLLTNSLIVPSPRISACITFYSPQIYIYGGYTSSGLVSDLWFYDSGFQQYVRLSDEDENGPGKISHQVCTLEIKDGEYNLYVMFGTGDADTPKSQVHKYDLMTHSWELLFTSKIRRNKALVQKIGNKILVAGGQTWGVYVHDQIYYIDLQQQSITPEGNLGFNFIQGIFVHLQNSIYIHGGSYPIGSIMRIQVPWNGFYRLDLNDICQECDWTCSIGSQKTQNGNCTLCPAGYFSEISSNQICEPCSAGNYAERVGSNSWKQCIPCPEGSYNQYQGAAYCILCPSQAVCPIGSSFYSFDTDQYDSTSDQPEFYNERTAEANTYTNYVYIATCITALIVVVLFLAIKKLRNLLASLDLYKLKHNHILGEPIVLTKNLFGGIFSVVFMVLALMLIATSFILYLVDNITQTKALVPMIVLQNQVDHVIFIQFDSDFTIQAELFNYYTYCQIQNTGTCHQTIQYSLTGTHSQQEILSCYQDETTCFVQLECLQCELESAGKLTFTLTDQNSYASGISINITSFSSIPDQYSITTQYIKAEANNVYRGYPASKFFYTMTPSLYNNQINGQQRTGYHVSTQSTAQPGASYQTSEVSFINDLSIEVELSRSQNALVTVRFEKSPLFILLSALLGSIFGIMNAVGGLMAFFEGKQKNYNINSDKKRVQEKVSLNGIRLKRFLTDRETDDAQTSSGDPLNVSFNKMMMQQDKINKIYQKFGFFDLGRALLIL